MTALCAGIHGLAVTATVSMMMLALSNILMQGHGIDSFSALKEVLRERVHNGEHDDAGTE